MYSCTKRPTDRYSSTRVRRARDVARHVSRRRERRHRLRSIERLLARSNVSRGAREDDEDDDSETRVRGIRARARARMGDERRRRVRVRVVARGRGPRARGRGGARGARARRRGEGDARRRRRAGRAAASRDCVTVERGRGEKIREERGRDRCGGGEGTARRGGAFGVERRARRRVVDDALDDDAPDGETTERFLVRRVQLLQRSEGTAEHGRVAQSSFDKGRRADGRERRLEDYRRRFGGESRRRVGKIRRAPRSRRRRVRDVDVASAV